MKQECKDCNKSLEDCTCLEDTIELPNQALKDAAERYSEIYRCPATNENEYCRHDIISAFNNGAKWQQEQIGKSEFLQKLRATKSDAEARRLIRTI